MPVLYLNEDRTLVRRDSEDCLLLQLPEQRDGQGQVIVPARKERVGVAKIESVVVMGEVTLTASALHLLLERNVEVNFLGYFGQFKGRLSPPLSKNSLLRLAQHQAHHAMPRRAELARRFALGKLLNQRTLLQRYNRRLDKPEISEEVANLGAITGKLSRLELAGAVATRRLANNDTGIIGSPIETILGLEGSGSAAYFRCFGSLLSDSALWPWAGRFKRPPTDPLNSLLSFGYSMLTNQIASVVQTVGFDQYIGYLHSSTYGRPALALDLIEEFRPVIVDSVVLTVLNNRMLKPADFICELDAYRLKPEAKRLFLARFEDRLNEEVQHPLFGYRVKYRRCLELQARLLAKYLTGELPQYTPFTVR